MAQNRIAKNLNTVDLFTGLDEPAHLWRVQETLNQEFNSLELSNEKSSSELNQRSGIGNREFNSLEPSNEKSSSELNHGSNPKRRGARGKQFASGYIYPYTKNKKLKSGIIATYPRVEGSRNPDNLDHWYWGYSYKENIDGEWKNRSLPVPTFRVRTVKEMIASDMSVAAIKTLIKGKFAE